MLTRVAISPHALDTSTLPIGISDSLHHTMTETLLQHGRLVTLSGAEMDELVQMVRGTRIPGVTTRKKWEVLLTELRKHHRVVALDVHGLARLADAQSLDALVSVGHGWMDLIVLADSDADRLGVSSDCSQPAPDGIPLEIARLATTATCATFGAVKARLIKKVWPLGDSRDAFWEHALRPLADGAKAMTIIDRYLFSTLNRIHKGKVSWPAGLDEHVVWFLRALDRIAAEGATVSLCAAKAQAWHLDATELAQLIVDRWNPGSSGRLGCVTVEVAEPPSLADYPHDRHVRFNTGVAIGIHAGFDRLSELRITNHAGMQWDYSFGEQIKALQGRESLRHAFDFTEAIVLDRRSS